MAADSLSVATDTWYRLSIASLTGGETYKSTSLFDADGTKGAVFFGKRNDDNYRDHMWQLVPIGDENTDVFVLRSWGAGPSAYLAVGAGTGAKPGDGRVTEPLLKKNTTVTNVEVLWTIKSWGKDAGFHLHTPLNGSNWRLAEKAGQSFMTDEEGPTDRQSWSFASTGEKINNVNYSVVRLPQTTFSITKKSSPTTSSNTTPTPTTPTTTTQAAGKETVFVTQTPSLPSESQSSSSSSSSKNTTTIAVGVAVPICVLALVGLAFFFIRRRSKQRSQNFTELVVSPVEIGASTRRRDSFKSQQQPDQRYYELGSPGAVELQSTHSHTSTFAELPGTPYSGGKRQ